MNKLTALGLELDYDADSIHIIPVNAIVIAEGLDSDGDMRHVVMHTPGLSWVHAGGLVNLAKNWTDMNIMMDLVRSAYSEDDDSED